MKSWLTSGTAQEQTSKIKCFAGGLGYAFAAQGLAVGFGAQAIGGKIANMIMGLLGFGTATLGGDSPVQCLAGIDLLEVN